MKNMAGKLVVLVGLLVIPVTACLLSEAPQAEATYAITIGNSANGMVSASKSTAREGEIITLTALPDSGYKLASIRASGGRDIALSGGGSVRTFTMPAQQVAVRADFLPVDPDSANGKIALYDIKIVEDMGNGSFTIDGIETDGDNIGKARAGAIITITAAPHPGYKLADGEPLVRYLGADARKIALTRRVDQAAWTFVMADADLEIILTFAELGLLDIYKGHARKGITVGELSDDKKYYQYAVNMESEMPGHNGNSRSIQITAAANDNGNAVQQSFGLFSDTEINLETVSALSFWAKANKSLNIRYVGFGDDDPNKRVVYTGENFNQSIPLTDEWNHYIVPVPAPHNGQKMARVFMFNAQIAAENYVCIDDIEFLQSGVTLTGIEIPDTNKELFYGSTEAAKILQGLPMKLTYAHVDGTTATLQCAGNSHTLKYNLARWLLPFIQINGSNALVFFLDIAGKTSNTMTARIIDGILLDDFEDLEGSGNITIPANPASGTGYRWHTNSGSPVVVGRDYINVENREIHSGLRAGSWRPAATANNPRGGRNFTAKDASGYHTLTFWIKVTTGGNTVIQSNTVFTFELRNDGLLTNKTSGVFFVRQFTYDPGDTAINDGWQEITMPLADFTNAGLNVSAITGYAVSVVDNQGVGLRIMLDDIALVK